MSERINRKMTGEEGNLTAVGAIARSRNIFGAMVKRVDRPSSLSQLGNNQTSAVRHGPV